MSSDITLEQLLEAGAHFGHQVRRWNPAMKSYIYGVRNGVHIFDLVKTKEGLDKACEKLRELKKEDKKVLLVGTKRQVADKIRKIGQETGNPYVSVRWMGGTLTNFAQIRKSIAKMQDLVDKRERGELKKYTKKEQLLIDREIAKLSKFFAGIAGMTEMPAAMFVVDTHREMVAVLEAKKVGVPVIGIADTNSDPSLLDIVIPMNDDAEKGLELVLGAISEALSSKS